MPLDKSWDVSRLTGNLSLRSCQDARKVNSTRIDEIWDKAVEAGQTPVPLLLFITKQRMAREHYNFMAFN
jgi:hypothetical protein